MKEAEFKTLFSKDGDHLIYTKAVKEVQFQRVSINGKIDTISRHIYRLTYGALLPEMSVYRTCDRPDCVEPAHLIAVYKQDIQKLMELKGAALNGEKVGNKLSSSQVVEIKKLLEEGKLTQEKIADQFGVQKSTIAAIRQGRVWKRV